MSEHDPQPPESVGIEKRADLLRDRHLWFLLHGIVVLIGLGLVAALLVTPICH
jgi:hypothetical protein